MAIRKADAVILCYSIYDPSSFHQLANVADDFKSRKNSNYVSFVGYFSLDCAKFKPYVVLIANEDEQQFCSAESSHTSIVLDGAESIEHHGESSESEGYGSSTGNCFTLKCMAMAHKN